MVHTRRWCLITGLSLATICLGLLIVSVDRRIGLLALNSCWLSLGACLVSLPLGTLLALLLVRTDLPLRRGIWLLLIALLLLPLHLHAAAWDAGFGKLGWYSLARLSLDAPLLHGWGAAIWIHGLWSVPWVTLIVSAVLGMCEPELEEEALLDAPAWRVWRSVTLRRAMPGVVVAGLWVALITAGEMTVTDLYQIRTLAEELYTGFALSPGSELKSGTGSFGKGPFGTDVYGAGTALLFTGVLVGLALVALDLLVVAAQHVPSRAPFVFPLGRWRIPLFLFVTVMLLGLVGVPLGNLVYQAGTMVRHVDGNPIRDWSLGSFVEVLVPLPGTYQYSAIWQFSNAFGWTLLIGICAASLTLVIAVLLAWLARGGEWHVLPAALTASVGTATLGPLVGLGLIWLFTLSDHAFVEWFADRTIGGPVLAATVRALPLPITVCFVAFSTLHSDTLDAATLDGAGRWSRLWCMGVRQRLPAMLVAWLVAFAIACGELSATILVNPAGITTVPIRVFRLLHAGVRNQVAAICLTSIVGFLLVALVVTWLAPRISPTRRPKTGATAS